MSIVKKADSMGLPALLPRRFAVPGIGQNFAVMLKIALALTIAAGSLVAVSPIASAQMSTPMPMKSTMPKKTVKMKTAKSTSIKTTSKAYNTQNTQKPMAAPTP